LQREVTMNRTITVAVKELTEIFKDRRTVLVSLFFALFFSIMYSMQFLDKEKFIDMSTIDSSVFFLSTAVGFFVVYMSTSQIFLREKLDKVIETVMCTPLTLREMWCGKVLAITIFSYSLAIFTAVIIATASSFFSGALLLPGAPVFFHVFIGVPVFAAAIAGLMGFVQLYLGLRENRIVNFIIFVPIFAALYGAGYVIGSNVTISWSHVGILLLISAGLMGISAYLIGHLSRERIITTIS
jgi:ABC-2 type transport system permease protein